LVLKCYKNERWRDRAFENQLLGWRHGLGPEPWGRRNLIDTEWCFAYISRRAASSTGTHISALNELGRRMKAAGFSDNDLCHSNAGMIYGRLVCVDFDPLSVNRGNH
jgi:hypothetical protein